MANAAATAMVKATKEVKKVTLWERFKNYLIENVDIIAPGIIMMNGGTGKKWYQYQVSYESGRIHTGALAWSN